MAPCRMLNVLPGFIPTAPSPLSTPTTQRYGASYFLPVPPGPARHVRVLLSHPEVFRKPDV